jgi:hypothetical protein
MKDILGPHFYSQQAFYFQGTPVSFFFFLSGRWRRRVGGS